MEMRIFLLCAQRIVLLLLGLGFDQNNCTSLLYGAILQNKVLAWGKFYYAQTHISQHDCVFVCARVRVGECVWFWVSKFLGRFPAMDGFLLQAHDAITGLRFVNVAGLPSAKQAKLVAGCRSSLAFLRQVPWTASCSLVGLLFK